MEAREESMRRLGRPAPARAWFVRAYSSDSEELLKELASHASVAVGSARRAAVAITTVNARSGDGRRATAPRSREWAVLWASLAGCAEESIDGGSPSWRRADRFGVDGNVGVDALRNSPRDGPSSNH